MDPIRMLYERASVYTRTVGVVPFGIVPFGSSVNGQNQMQSSQKRTDMKMRYYSFVCFSILRAKYRRRLGFSSVIGGQTAGKHCLA